MSLQKAVFFGAVALALSACGSSGNGSNTPNSSATNTKIQQPSSDKAAAEKATAEKAAAEKAAAEKAAAEKAAAEKAAAERAAAERKLKIDTLVKKAVDLGLTNEEARTLAEENENTDDTSFTNAIEAFKAQKIIREIDNAKGIVSTDYQNGFSTSERSISSESKSSCVNFSCTTWSGTTETGKALYNQQYSVVMGDYLKRYGTLNGRQINEGSFQNLIAQGLKTNVDKIPNVGQATYKGEAFDGSLNRGSLSYLVDFAKRIGSGSITGLGSQIELQQGSISGTGISASAVQDGLTGSYILNFFGKSAEEIAGKVQFDGNDSVGFGGKRGEITQ